ncbi:MAG: alpha/beta hydrolase, partial [Clostridia bacterium]|nr:alpha/beta hydrolase [Clostridia bacterium]
RTGDVRGMALLFPGFGIPDDWNARYPDDDKIPATIPWWWVDLGRDFVLSLRDIDIYANMASFTKPVLLMHGTNDNTVPLSYSQRASETYPNAELVIYQGEGHGFSAATMKKVNDKLLAFIDETLLNKEI